jgi:hypothetical protein
MDQDLNTAATRIEELEAKLAQAVEALSEIATDEHPLGWIAHAIHNQHARIEELESNIRELFVLLERVEETDEGRTLHPIQIYCCRAVDGEKLR